MPLQRALLVEAGHRCAIPTCRQWPTEFAHITPYSRVQEHTFENLIVLCPTCHSRYDQTKEIDRRAMLQYKANLEVMNHRYTDVERQLLKTFIDGPPGVPSLKQIAEERAKMERDRDAGRGHISESVLHMMEEAAAQPIRIPASLRWMISNLIDDFLVETEAAENTWGALEAGDLHTIVVRLTDKGVQFIERWASAQPI
ncbi:HNH endonuclease [Streptomyces sp. NPDC055815]